MSWHRISSDFSLPITYDITWGPVLRHKVLNGDANLVSLTPPIFHIFTPSTVTVELDFVREAPSLTGKSTGKCRMWLTSPNLFATQL